MMAAAMPGNQKLSELTQLLRNWSQLLLAYVLFAIGIMLFVLIYAKPFDDHPSENTIALFGVVLAALLGFLGVLVTKYFEIKRQFVDTKNAIIDHEDELGSRLLAFHAEIAENVVTLIRSYSPEYRKSFIDTISSDPDRDSFTRSDASNPIFEENKKHLYQFEPDTIRTIINYYNEESNLNLAIDTLALPQFRSLKPAQKLKWHLYMLELANDVAKAGYFALRAIELEARARSRWPKDHWGRNLTFHPEHSEQRDFDWHEISKKELEPIIDKLKELQKPQGTNAPKSPKRPRTSNNG